MDSADPPDVGRIYQIHEVFSTGRTPDATYNARLGAGLETKLKGYVRTASSAVTVFGPSKSGKTSLVERVIPETDACWIQGSDIQSIDDFWSIIADRLRIAKSLSSEESTQRAESLNAEGGLSAGGFATAKYGAGQIDTDGSKTTANYDLKPEAAAKELLAKLKLPIVIDDFHHVNPDIRKRIARAIKAIIRHTCVVLIAIPSQAFDPVRNEQDLNGRIKSLPVPEWTIDELAEIGVSGFDLLNLNDPKAALALELARYSFGSPHIMQELCLTVLTEGFDIQESAETQETISVPSNLQDLLRAAAIASEPPFFAKLIEGRPTRGKVRSAVKLTDSETETDIYGVVMQALRNITPPMEHTLREIQQEVNRLSMDTVKRGRITSVLRGLDAIASKNAGDSDPVLSYKDERLYIEDSVFAFYLNHGPWKFPTPV
ncbi:hypothetical protein [Mycolicibacterium setense]|nr:hypothetical protein [Mycolicibacterium setense]